MMTNRNSQERVLIFGVHTDAYTDHLFETLMDEMEELTQTAGGEVVAVVTQRLHTLNAHTAVGSGKLKEIANTVDFEEIDLVIAMNELKPSMNRQLEEVLEVRVIDRVQLILDIFALRAKSREGQLQVELAQNEYLLPRLHGQGLAMSRLGGGIGTRGPGETQLETDRRHIRNQITRSRRELAALDAHRERTRSRRQMGGDFNIGLVGYTNSGKSTLLNALTGADSYVQDQLFATLDPLTRQLSIHGHDCFTLTDTVGFIEELPTELIEAFKSTLEEMRDMTLILHVVDSSSPSRELHEETVIALLKDLEVDHLPLITVYNKKDLLDRSFEGTLYPNVLISAYEADDLEKLKDRIWEIITENAKYYRQEIDPMDAVDLAWYRQNTLVEHLDFDEEKNLYVIEGYQKKYED